MAIHGRIGLVNVIGHGIDLVEVAEMRRWIEDPRDPNIITQFVYADGEYIDNPVSFIVDKSPDAMSRYDLRDL